MTAAVLALPARLRARLGARRALAEVHARMGRIFGAAARDAANLLDRACPVCGARDPESRAEVRAPVYSFHRCRTCTMLYAPRVLDPAVVAQRYAGSALQRTYRALLGEGVEAAAYAGLAARLAAESPGRGAALDVGCGHGGLLAALATRFDDALGLELDPELAESARRRFGVVVAVERLERLPRPDGSIDLVTMNQILEHVLEPRAIVEAARRLLRPGGVSWISVPQGGSLGMSLLGGRHPTVATHMHVNLFEVESLRALVEQVGLRVDAITSDADPDLGGGGALAFASEKVVRLALGRSGVLERLRRGAHLEVLARRP
jgi:SAM-dependent methyltransferase